MATLRSTTSLSTLWALESPRRKNVRKRLLIKKLQDKTAKIGILGMGYVGMPLAVVFAEGGFNVLGIDPDQRKVDTFNKDVSYIQDVPSETVARLHKAGKLNMTDRFCGPERDGCGQHLRARHRSASPATRICRSSFRPPSNWRSMCTRAW